MCIAAAAAWEGGAHRAGPERRRGIRAQLYRRGAVRWPLGPPAVAVRRCGDVSHAAARVAVRAAPARLPAAAVGAACSGGASASPPPRATPPALLGPSLLHHGICSAQRIAEVSACQASTCPPSPAPAVKQRRRWPLHGRRRTRVVSSPGFGESRSTMRAVSAPHFCRDCTSPAWIRYISIQIDV